VNLFTTPLSTEPRLPRCIARAFVQAGRVAVWAALLLILGASEPDRVQAAEEPLEPDFLEYLGSVESSGIKGLDTMTLDELYQLLKGMLKETVSGKKPQDQPKGKDNERRDEPNH
jgi:hypothetical protein